MTTTFKEASIYYTSEGEGNPIVLLHGFLESGEIWESFIAEFGQRRQIVNIDLPGHGLSGLMTGEPSVELMAELTATTVPAAARPLRLRARFARM